MNDIVAHQRVVEVAREKGTVLPVRFGVILKNEDGVKKLLASSYKDYGKKISTLRGKDEIGIKVLMGKSSLKKIQEAAEEQSSEIKKIKAEMSAAKPGTTYFLKLRPRPRPGCLHGQDRSAVTAPASAARSAPWPRQSPRRCGMT